MSKRRDPELLCDITDSISRIENYIKEINFENFKRDQKTQDAVIRNLEIIGEASKIISNEIKNEMPTIPWKKMAGIRDHLFHNYSGINLDIVWNVVSKELSPIKETIVSSKQ